MHLDQTLVDTAAALLEQRFPGRGGIAAAAYTDEGGVLTGVVFDPDWGTGGLCAETGPILEATKLDVAITASACVSRLSGDAPIVILTPCGVCQERLFHWGGDVQVASPEPDDPRRWVMRTLAEIQPHHWVKAFRG